MLVIQLHLTLYDPVDCSLPGCSIHGVSPGKNTEVGCHALLQGMFPTQGSNLGLPHYRQIFTIRVTSEGSRLIQVTIIKKMLYRCKDRQMTQWNRIERLKEVLRHMCPFTYHKDGTVVGNSLFRKKILLQLDAHMKT